MEGEVTHVGLGHSASIKRLRIDPSGQYIVSVSNDGAILRWRFPHALSETEEQQQLMQSAT